MKRLLLLCMTALISVLSYADTYTLSVIQLTNGTIIEGILIEDNENFVRVQLPNRNRRVVYKSDIVSITNSEKSSIFYKDEDNHKFPTESEQWKVTGEEYFSHIKGFQQYAYCGLDIGQNHLPFTPININIGYICGYRFNKYIFTGGGIEYTPISFGATFSELFFSQNSISTLANIHAYYPIGNIISIFLSVSSGVRFSCVDKSVAYHCHYNNNSYDDIYREDYKSIYTKTIPFILNPEIGAEFVAGKNCALFISAGLSYVKGRTIRGWYPCEYNESGNHTYCTASSGGIELDPSSSLCAKINIGISF